MEYDTKKVLRSENDLNANEKSAVEELFNILMGHYIAALSNFLQAQFDPPNYQFFFKKSKALFSQLELGKDSKEVKAIVVETLINVADGPEIRGQFILLLHPKVFRRNFGEN